MPPLPSTGTLTPLPAIYQSAHSFGATPRGPHATPPLHQHTHAARRHLPAHPIGVSPGGSPCYVSSPPARPRPPTPLPTTAFCRGLTWLGEASGWGTPQLLSAGTPAQASYQTPTLCRRSPRLVALPEGHAAHAPPAHTQHTLKNDRISTPSFFIYISLPYIYYPFSLTHITDPGVTTASTPVSHSPPPHRERPSPSISLTAGLIAPPQPFESTRTDNVYLSEISPKTETENLNSWLIVCFFQMGIENLDHEIKNNVSIVNVLHVPNVQERSVVGIRPMCALVRFGQYYSKSFPYFPSHKLVYSRFVTTDVRPTAPPYPR